MLVYTVVFACFLCCIYAQNSNWDFQYDPPNSLTIRTDETETLTLNITTYQSNIPYPLSLKLESVDNSKFQVSEPIKFLQNSANFFNISTEIYANFLGRTSLNLQLIKDSENSAVLHQENYEIVVLRSKRGVLLSTIFTVIITLFVIINTFLMGTQLDISVIKEVLKKPYGPIIGFCCQFLLMPLVNCGTLKIRI